MHFGIDFGAKLAGTTAVVYMESNKLTIHQSAKKSNADDFLVKIIEEHYPNQIFIDAPLSLPGVYKNKDSYSDYFYRDCDRQTKAMSPMFLGALTARAIKLCHAYEKDIRFFEAYPKLMNQQIDIEIQYYQKSISDIQSYVNILLKQYPFLRIDKMPTSWHQVDAILAWLVGYRYNKGQSLVYGKRDEGLIYV